MSNREFIETICDVLRHSNVLHSKCAIDLIKLIEELARYSISPIELKSLFCLLREKENFDYRKQMLQVRLNSKVNFPVCLIGLFSFLFRFSWFFSFFRLWRPYHCTTFQVIRTFAVNFSTSRLVMKVSLYQKSTNGPRPVHLDSSFMRGFDLMKLQNGSRILISIVRDIGALFSGGTFFINSA